MGIDAGSKTVKVVLLDEAGNIAFSAYHRHRSDIRQTLRQLVHDISWRKGNLEVKPLITGSAGIGVSEVLGIPFIQEVIATTTAVRHMVPEADAVIELGGEDAKVIYLTGGVEQRMNATCAGGTGGFIDTIAFMLGVRTSDISTLAMGASRTYPIASRCAVFAQTDVRPLLNEGVPKHDIAASALDAVVKQTLGGLACGRPIKGNVVFLGGPLEHIPDLVSRFRKALGLNHRTGIKPKDAHLYPALGAALAADGNRSATFRLEELLEAIDATDTQWQTDDLERLEPLFESEEDLEAFRTRHNRSIIPTSRIFDAEGPLYLGIDAGSTTVKLALMDSEGHLVHSDYRPSRGDTINTVREMLVAMHANIPKRMLPGREQPYIAHATATGYGEAMLIKGFGVDSGTVETAAHVRAAQHVCPDATFVMDIGGQDMKALWLNDGFVKDAVLNEACSSGCGAFIEGTAHALSSRPVSFANAALLAEHPVDLGTRCTVFMSSRVKHAQKAGASLEDIAAGVAYSVVQNALFRIIGKDRLGSLGNHIVVQGGTFKSDAVLRAFEKICGVEVMRPDQAHLMGAIGAALIARSRDTGRSSILSEEDLHLMKPSRTSLRCNGCQNSCLLSALNFGNGSRIITGNRCPKGAQGPIDADGHPISDLADTRPRISAEEPDGPDDAPHVTAPPVNLVAREQELISEFCNMQPAAHEVCNGENMYGNADPQPQCRRSISVGLLNALEMYRYTPFWHTLLSTLGFSVIMPQKSIPDSMQAKAWETIPAEGVCFPAKLVHAQAYSLKDQGADAILFPAAERNNHCAVACEYAHALFDGIEWLRNDETAFLSPKLSSIKPAPIKSNPNDAKALHDAFAPLCSKVGAPLSDKELDEALDAALSAQKAFEQTLAQETDEALEGLAANPDVRAVILAGRPYHMDAAVLHGIDRMLAELGFWVFGITGLEHRYSKTAHRSAGLPEWRPAKRLLKAARFAAETPRLELVCLQSFGCGYDAMSLEEVRSILEMSGRPFTALKIDEMVETAHIRIRLRTLAETVRLSSDGGMCIGSDAAQSLQVPEEAEAGIQNHSNAEPVELLGTPLDEEDLAISRTATVKDVCFSATILAARAIRMLKEDPSIQALSLPEACKDCLNEAIPRIVERATGLTPSFAWKHSMPETGAKDASHAHLEGPKLRPKIGIIGNPLLVFEPYMNDGIAALIEGLGCEAVFPDEDSLYTEDVRYIDQLESFERQGVRHVIYLQSFGCVKGHVFARGSHSFFAERFPNMPVTVIDYDPEASALNRENRIRLIAESVLGE